LNINAQSLVSKEYFRPSSLSIVGVFSRALMTLPQRAHLDITLLRGIILLLFYENMRQAQNTAQELTNSHTIPYLSQGWRVLQSL
jgi:hypothetical protein